MQISILVAKESKFPDDFETTLKELELPFIFAANQHPADETCAYVFIDADLDKLDQISLQHPLLTWLESGKSY